MTRACSAVDEGMTGLEIQWKGCSSNLGYSPAAGPYPQITTWYMRPGGFPTLAQQVIGQHVERISRVGCDYSLISTYGCPRTNKPARSRKG